MNIQSWMIKSWTTLEWYLSAHAENLPRFSHVNTQIRDEGDATGLRSGDTVWLAQDEEWHVGLAWEWVEVKPGLVMLADPNSIITNLQLVDSQQRNVVGLAKTVAINRLVHAMPWQQPVCNVLMGPTPSTQDESLASDSGANLPQMQSLQKRIEHTPGARHLSAQGQRMAEAVGKRPAVVQSDTPQSAVVHMGAQAALRPRQRNRGRSADREEGTMVVAARELRRAA